MKVVNNDVLLTIQNSGKALPACEFARFGSAENYSTAIPGYIFFFKRIDRSAVLAMVLSLPSLVQYHTALTGVRRNHQELRI